MLSEKSFLNAGSIMPSAREQVLSVLLERLFFFSVERIFGLSAIGQNSS